MALPLIVLAALAGLTGAGAAKVKQAIDDPDIDLIPGLGSNEQARLDAARKKEQSEELAQMYKQANPQFFNTDGSANQSWTAPTAPTAPTANTVGSGGGGGSSSAKAAPSQAQISNLLSALSALDITRANNLSQAQSEYGKATQGYADDFAQDTARKEKQVSDSENALAANRQAALLSAARGGSGLRSVLASLGALSGTGGHLAHEAVATEANKDIGEADNAFRTSADSINTAWADTERKQRQRMAEAEATLSNTRQNAEQSYLSGQQNVYNQLASLYGNDTAQGGNYLAKAGALYAPLSATTQTAVAPYAPSSSLYSPQALEAYKAGTNNLTVSASPRSAGEGVLNSPLYALSSIGRKRERELV